MRPASRRSAWNLVRNAGGDEELGGLGGRGGGGGKGGGGLGELGRAEHGGRPQGGQQAGAVGRHSGGWRHGRQYSDHTLGDDLSAAGRIVRNVPV